MKHQDAKDIFNGQKMFSRIPQSTPAEKTMLLFEACLDFDGEIICLRCGRRYEYCKCE
jgi:hypothetical protein